jgi:hypothetical protein
MRSGWLRVLLFALAVAMQALLPAAASVVSRDASDPGQAFQLCFKSSDIQGEHAPFSNPKWQRHNCALCQALDTAPAFSDAANQTGAPLAPAQRMIWPAFRGDSVAPPRESARQPRAPPKFS